MKIFNVIVYATAAELPFAPYFRLSGVAMVLASLQYRISRGDTISLIAPKDVFKMRILVAYQSISNMDDTVEEFENTSEIIREHFPNGCPKCGMKRFSVEEVAIESMEWMGRGIIDICGIAIRITCKNCGRVEHISLS